MTCLLAVQAFATLYMVGVIWMCQIAHYPLLSDIGTELPQYQERNMRLTSYVVGLPMLAELATALALLVWRPPALPLWTVLVGLALIVIIWLATIIFSVPNHGRLARGFTAQAHSALVRTNWIRTIAWTLRGVLVVWMLAAA